MIMIVVLLAVVLLVAGLVAGIWAAHHYNKLARNLQKIKEQAARQRQAVDQSLTRLREVRSRPYK